LLQKKLHIKLSRRLTPRVRTCFLILRVVEAERLCLVLRQDVLVGYVGPDAGRSLNDRAQDTSDDKEKTGQPSRKFFV